MKYACTGAVATLAASATAQAQEITIDLTDIGSWDSAGSASNIVLTEALPAASIVSGVTWTDVTGSGLGGTSWGNEMSMNINGEIDVQFFPDEGSGSAGGDWGPASGSASANFTTDALVIEFYESYEDGAGVLDAEYTGGTIIISYRDDSCTGDPDVCQPACLLNTACDGGDAVYPADQGASIGDGGVACSDGTVTTANSFMNVYDADTVNPDGYALSCVAIPVTNSGSFLEAGVSVVSIPDPSAPSIATIVLLGDGTICMDASNAGIAELTFDEPIAIEVGSAFGIVMDVPASTDGFAAFDVMDAPDGAATYIFAADCSLNDFVGYPGLGFPDPEWTIQMSFVADDEPCTGDLNGDGEVGFGDLQLILSAWESSTDGDANGDGVTNFADLQVILSAWDGC